MKFVLAAAAALVLAGPAVAQHHNHGAAAPAATPAAVQGAGVVKSVDAKAGTITIAHEAIKALNWSAMTMPFKVSDPSLLKSVAAGDRVAFQLKGQQIVSIRRL